jgi:UDP-N-acetylglucosamine--N-acetylmuramyl-(pentapeptide) pyrophosphoryl-undecaprenol N-acetylglucosamine transferase
VTEVAAVGLPAVFVPLPIGNGEQALNARPVVDAGGGLLVDDGDLTPAWVSETVPALAVDTERLGAMSRAASGLIPRDADEQLARMVLAAAGGPSGTGERHADGAGDGPGDEPGDGPGEGEAS